MIAKLKTLSANKKLIMMIKLVFCALIIAWFCNCVYINGFDNYYSCMDYNYHNYFTDSTTAAGVQQVDQIFISKGNILSNLTLYFNEVPDSELSISIADKNGSVLCSRTIIVSDYDSESWNTISMEYNGIERNEEYHIILEGDDLSYIVLNTGNVFTKTFGECSLDGTAAPYTLAAGVTETYRYMMLGYGLQLVISLLFTAVLAVALCYIILNMEKIYASFINTEKKSGLLYALYFSVYTVLLFNPVDTIRTKAVEFARVIGVSINAGVDVTKRTSNFNHWFIYFAIAFTLFFLLANYLKSQKFEEEDQKIVDLLDNIIILANLILGLRCITYFANEAVETDIFYYSDFIIMAIMLLVFAYIKFDIKTKITAEKFEAIIITVWMIALPASMVMTHDWVLGRVFMGLQVIASILAVVLIRFLKIDWNSDKAGRIINTFVLTFSLIPFCTSLYIEFIVWLNQKGYFVTHLRRYYSIAIILGIIFSGMLAWICVKKNKSIKHWKTFTYPAIIFGFACLWQQIGISVEQSVDILETPNFSILISDFLNFGKIPIIEHYGGHMMTGVWEALVYALLNNDFAGAAFTPYSGYAAAAIAVLFFLLVKYIWDEDAALLVVLFFPFYSSISYWGLGILTALAAMAYVKKNTYVRAGLFWLACIWCALYRLDLGFAFIFACISALAVYMVFNKNLNALKQLAVTLGIWGMIGLGLWCGVCLAKDINPINRLLEFLYISLSNQNWAHTDIGDISLTRFGFIYILLPFMSVIALLYLVFSKKIKKELGNAKWVMIMILGFSYLYNFSRGLVRHSLAENLLMVCLWTGPLFLSVFLAIIKKNWKLFMPAFTVCILLFTLFQSDNNFTENSIADNAVAHVGDYTKAWTLGRFAEEEFPEGEIPRTYWTQIRDDQEVIQRVEWTEDLKKTVQNYQVVIDGLLEDDETFADFINKTFLYPLLGRENPAYVSQSPMQLSGEFAQEEFVKEIAGVPIVLMPYADENFRNSAALDGVSNSYRYYKVAEYIYQNYVPLCTYEDQYAVWCLSDRYDELAAKVEQLKASGTDITNDIAAADNIRFKSVELVSNTDESLDLNFTGTDPAISELQNVIDTTAFMDKNMSIAVEYETDVMGQMQIFYTTDPGESYNSDKVVTYDAQTNSGVAYFKIPITEYTRIRFDTPEGSSVKIKSFKVGVCNCNLAEYGYDGPYLQEDGKSYSYLPYLHSYDLDKLPQIWAEGDSEDSADNNVLADLNYKNGLYHYSIDDSAKGADGNYLKVHLTYNGNDLDGKIKSDDETVDATIRVGKYVNGVFETKYYYTFTVEEGTHDYMFRVSSDYYWYIGETDSVQLECEGQLLDVNMQILEGD